MFSEIEIYGHGGPVARPSINRAEHRDTRTGRADSTSPEARGGSSARNFITAMGEALSKSGFQDAIGSPPPCPEPCSPPISVPAIPDPNFGQNQLHISDSYFYSDFWYRTEFQAPPIARDEVAWLNFDGINWKADVFLNGEKSAASKAALCAGAST